METLSNVNDFIGSWLGFLPIALAGIILIFILRKKYWYNLYTIQFPIQYYFNGLAVVIVVISILFLSLTPIFPWGGGDKYFLRAFNVMTFGVFGYGNEPTALFPPGYSFIIVPFIALLGVYPAAYFAPNLFLLIGSSIALRGILLKLGIKQDLANLFATAVILYPNRFLSTLLPFSDIPFSLIYMIAFGFFLIYSQKPERIAYLIPAILCAGIAALTRSNGILLFLPIVLGILLQREVRLRTRLLLTALSMIVFCIVLGPWTIRNYFVFHKFVPVSTNGGVNLALANNPSNPLVKDSILDSVWESAPSWVTIRKAQWNEAQQDSFFATQGLQYIREHPLIFFMQGFKKLFRAFIADSYSFGYLMTYTDALPLFTGEGSDHEQIRLITLYNKGLYKIYQFLFIINNVWYYLILLFSIFCIFSLKKDAAHIRWPFITLYFFVCLFIFIIFGLSRYKEPLGTIQILAIALYYLRDKQSEASTTEISRRSDCRRDPSGQVCRRFYDQG
ncbi:MAG: hypothetical protein ABSB78_08605 [Bacteroidota bacterium]